MAAIFSTATFVHPLQQEAEHCERVTGSSGRSFGKLSQGKMLCTSSSLCSGVTADLHLKESSLSISWQQTICSVKLQVRALLQVFQVLCDWKFSAVMQKSSCRASDQSLHFPPSYKESLKTFSFFTFLDKTDWKEELVVKFAASKDFI